MVQLITSLKLIQVTKNVVFKLMANKELLWVGLIQVHKEILLF